MWSASPQVHVIGHWTYPAGTRKTVYVVSNCESVELFVNGTSLGTRTPSDRFLFTFTDVDWAAGEIRAVGRIGDRTAATQTKRTAGEPVALRVTPITGPGGWRADGSDVLLVDVEAVDAAGERCPTFQKRVDFETEGPGVWRGGYNSGRANSTNKAFLDLEAGINRVSVRSTRQAGAVTIRARAEGLAAGTLTVRSSPVEVKNGATALRAPSPAPPVPIETPALAPVDGVLLQPGARRVLADTGRFATSFSYSGPAQGVRVDRDTQAGERIYTDSDAPFEDLPPELVGADDVQTAQADRLYKAVDLIEITVKPGSVVWIAHDAALPRPRWLTDQFEATDVKWTADGRPMTLFRRASPRGESLTLGSNVEVAGEMPGNMYVVFVGSAR
jgi:beta-galactosidase